MNPFSSLPLLLRQILRTPVPSALAILALGLGVGLVSTQFALIEGILLRNLPFRNSARLMHIGRTSIDGSGNGSWAWMPLRDFDGFRRQQSLFETFTAFSSTQLNYSGGSTPPRRFNGVLVTDDLLDSLQVKPVLGRLFQPGESSPGSPPLAILSHAAWQRDFGGQPDVIGKSIRLNGEPTTVVGVMPEGFHFPMNREDVWINLRADLSETAAKGTPWVEAMGHLKPGITRDQARAELNGIAARLAERWPESNKEQRSLDIASFPFAYAGTGTAPLLVVMLAMTLFVLLLACANVANLLLARTVRRAHELAIRVALGANRWQIVRGALAESLVLALLGATLGLGLAVFGASLLNRHVTEGMDVPFWFDFHINLPVVSASLALAALAGVIAGLLPALYAVRTDVHDVLKDGSRSGSNRGLTRFGRFLVTGQVALSCALLVGCTLLTLELIALKRLHLARNPDQLVVGRIELHDARYKDPDARSLFYRQVVGQVATIPGISHVAVSSRDLISPGVGIRFEMEGVRYDRDSDRPATFLEVVSPSYFETVGLGLVRGRLFNNSDVAGQPVVALVNQSFAQRHWPGQDPIGKRLRRHETDAPWATVVGIVPDLPMGGLGDFSGDAANNAGYYLCQDQLGWGWLSLLVRVSGNPQLLVDPIRNAVAAVDPNQPIHAINTLPAMSQRTLKGLQVVGTQSGIFGIIAAFLAAVGVFGVTSFAVSQRTREFGIHAALGADMQRITRMVLRQGASQLAIGLVIGLPLARLLVQPIGNFLSLVSISDPSVYLGVALLVGAVTTLSIWIPARRAARIDPILALRAD